MILAKVLSISLCMGVGSLTFANDPTPPAAATAAPAAADAADAASTAAAEKAKSATTTAKTATSPEGVTLDQAKTLRGAGYKADARKGGVTYYCRSQAQIGSRFETRVCGTPEDILRIIANSQELVNSLQHSPLDAPMPGRHE